MPALIATPADIFATLMLPLSAAAADDAAAAAMPCLR